MHYNKHDIMILLSHARDVDRLTSKQSVSIKYEKLTHTQFENLEQVLI